MADKPTEEPSIEEILGSIRRIIAEDDEQPGADSEDEEPLELTNKIDADGTITNAAVDQPLHAVDEPRDVTEQPIVKDESEPDMTPIETQSKPRTRHNDIAFNERDEEHSMSEISMDDTPANSEDTILSRSTADATAAVMSKLARHTVVTEQGHDGVTIENIVREMLKPLLRDWLDQNLPNIVQKTVERELQRLSQRI